MHYTRRLVSTLAAVAAWTAIFLIAVVPADLDPLSTAALSLLFVVVVVAIVMGGVDALVAAEVRSLRADVDRLEAAIEEGDRDGPDDGS